MKKLKDERLFSLIRNFLTIYLPKQRMCSPNTTKSYRESINLLLLFLQSQKNLALPDITFDILNAPTVQEFMDWLANERRCGSKTISQRLACIIPTSENICQSNKNVI